MNIKEFKIGDIITRNEPSAPFSQPRSLFSFATTEEPFRDRSYMTEPFKLFGVENNLIAIRHYDSKGDTLLLAEDKYGDGWVAYPMHLFTQDI
jgi:hypothetical protein